MLEAQISHYNSYAHSTVAWLVSKTKQRILCLNPALSGVWIFSLCTYCFFCQDTFYVIFFSNQTELFKFFPSLAWLEVMLGLCFWLILLLNSLKVPISAFQCFRICLELFKFFSSLAHSTSSSSKSCHLYFCLSLS